MYLSSVRRRMRGLSASPPARIEQLEQIRLLSAATVALTDHVGTSQVPFPDQSGDVQFDAAGHGYYTDPIPVFVAAETEPNPTSAPTSEAAPFPLGQTFQLHSKPGAAHRIYLDFDGVTTSGTAWNSLRNISSIVTPAYSIDSDPAFSTAELERIQGIWQRVTEDFIAFDVDVTTEEPTQDQLIRSGGNDQQWGIRVAIGGDGSWFGSAGGVAYLTSFNWNSDTPTFVFEDNLANGEEKATAEAASHEIGHTLGLSHDGTSSVTYYTGHGSGATGWAPIMGVGYYRELTQWSRGEYANANQTQDDLAIITSNNGFGFRADDHGDTTGSATAFIVNGTSLSANGIVERSSDVDIFSFTSGAGEVSLSISPFENSPNLDILAELINSSGTVLASSNPANTLNASLTHTVSAGTYYLRVSGAGLGDPLGTGYTDYSSIGYFSVTGTLPQATESAPEAVADAYSVFPGQTLTVSAAGVLSNDSDADNDPLTAVIVSGPSNASSFNLNADGSFTYTPNSGFTGTDSFSYQASDGSLESAVATVTITVDDSDATLIAQWQFDETSGSTATDSAGADNNGTLISGSFASDAERGQVVSLSGGNSVVRVDSTVDLNSTWTIGSWFNGLASGTWRTLTRGQGGDHQIIVSAGGQLGGYFNTGANGFVSSGFDMNSLSSGWHHVAAVGSGGSTVFYVDGQQVGSISRQSTTDVYTLGNYVDGGQRFSSHLDDLRVYNRALSASEIATLTDPGPAAPVASSDSYSVSPGSVLSVNAASGVLSNDTDSNGDSLTAAVVSSPSNSTSFTLNSDGSFSYTPATGFTGTDSFTYKASDGSLESAVATVTITVDDSDATLIAQWQFDETSGSTATDSAGADNNGTLISGSFASDAERGQVVSLSGGNSVVRVDSTVDLNSTWTIGSWFNGLASGTWRTLTRGQGGDHQIIVSAGGQLGGYFNTGANGFVSSGFDMNSLSSGWHHVAAVGSGGSTVFYVDGQQVGSISRQSTTDVYTLGNYVDGGQRFSSHLDDLRVYNRALSASEIATLGSSSGPAFEITSLPDGQSQFIATRSGGHAGSVVDERREQVKLQPALTVPFGITGVVDAALQADDSTVDDEASDAQAPISIASLELALDALVVGETELQ